MKKAGIMTLDSRIYNYGGLLQEYALFKLLGHLELDVEILDYDNNSELNTFSYKRSIRYLNLKKIKDKFNKLFKLNMVASLSDDSKKLFDKFRQNYMKFSHRCDRQNIEKIVDEYDYFICGSDQIWNPDYNIPAFFLDFVPEIQKKIIYAASLGVPKLTGQQKVVYKRFLSDIKYVSVREKNAKEIIGALTDQPVELVLDPTLLLDKAEWEGLICDKVNIKPYIFCYFLHQDECKYLEAQRFAQKYNLNIISVPEHKSDKPDIRMEENEKPVGPAEFLQLIHDAQFVLTDSFHATVFSIIFNKAFRVFPREINRIGMNGRIDTLLGYIDRNDLMIHPAKLANVEIITENYNNSVIEKKRKESINWIKEALKNGD